jgi:hypothetical protein
MKLIAEVQASPRFLALLAQQCDAVSRRLLLHAPREA